MFSPSSGYNNLLCLDVKLTTLFRGVGPLNYGECSLVLINIYVLYFENSSDDIERCEAEIRQ